MLQYRQKTVRPPAFTKDPTSFIYKYFVPATKSVQVYTATYTTKQRFSPSRNTSTYRRICVVHHKDVISQKSYILTVPAAEQLADEDAFMVSSR